MQKRMLLFVHYNKLGRLNEHVLYLLRNIKNVYAYIVFISNSPLDNDAQAAVSQIVDKIIVRPNTGYDFGAWRDAIARTGWEELEKYDSITFMNDTAFGPLFDFAPIYEEMEERGVDFWGMTAHRQMLFHPQLKGGMPKHIQSYFMCFTNKVVISSVFREFWERIENKSRVNDVIFTYEVKLTAVLEEHGFTYAVKCDASDYPIAPDNSTVICDIIIGSGIPLLKIKYMINIRYNNPKYVCKLLKEKSNYPVELIERYYSEMYPPHDSLWVSNKLIPVRETDSSPLDADCLSLKVAIYCHLFFLDAFLDFLELFSKFPFPVDLFFTTDSREKEEAITGLFKEHKCRTWVKYIGVFENNGQDIVPWLMLSDKLSMYDLVGHFHTTKSSRTDKWIDKMWLAENMELLLKPLAQIRSIFEKNHKIGIVFGEIPYYFQIIAPNQTSNHIKDEMNKLYKKMNCVKNIDFSSISSFVFPYGNMFWYRPAALGPLFALNVTYNGDVPPEPLANDHTVLHALERLLVYIVWNEDFDFRIMTTPVPEISSFQHHTVVAGYFSDLVLAIQQDKKKETADILRKRLLRQKR